MNIRERTNQRKGEFATTLNNLEKTDDCQIVRCRVPNLVTENRRLLRDTVQNAYYGHPSLCQTPRSAPRPRPQKLVTNSRMPTYRKGSPSTRHHEKNSPLPCKRDRHPSALCNFHHTTRCCSRTVPQSLSSSVPSTAHMGRREPDLLLSPLPRRNEPEALSGERLPSGVRCWLIVSWGRLMEKRCCWPTGLVD